MGRETEYHLEDLVWARLAVPNQDVKFWPARIVRPGLGKRGSVRFWKFLGRVHVEYFRLPLVEGAPGKTGKRIKDISFLANSSDEDEEDEASVSESLRRTGWVKEIDLVPFEPLKEGTVGFNDCGMRKAVNEASRWFRSRKHVPSFVRSQVKKANEVLTEKSSKSAATADGPSMKREPPNEEGKGTKSEAPPLSATTTKAEPNPSPEQPGLDVKRTHKAKEASSGWSTIMSSMRNVASAFPFGASAKEKETPAKTAAGSKRKRSESEKENSFAGNSRSVSEAATPTSSSSKVRRIITMAKLYSADEITDDMLESIPLRVRDKKKAVTDAEKEEASSCHQCRQKTLDLKTICRNPSRKCRSRLCGVCMMNIYGQDIKEALKDPAWTCPYCTGKCICSICMKRKGLQPVGRTVRENGFSVSEYVESGKKVIKKLVETVF